MKMKTSHKLFVALISVLMAAVAFGQQAVWSQRDSSAVHELPASYTAAEYLFVHTYAALGTGSDSQIGRFSVTQSNTFATAAQPSGIYCTNAATGSTFTNWVEGAEYDVMAGNGGKGSQGCTAFIVGVNDTNKVTGAIQGACYAADTHYIIRQSLVAGVGDYGAPLTGFWSGPLHSNDTITVRFDSNYLPDAGQWPFLMIRRRR